MCECYTVILHCTQILVNRRKRADMDNLFVNFFVMCIITR